MADRPRQQQETPGLHPRNRHTGRYPIDALVRTSPALAEFIQSNPAGEPTIDFANPAAVLALNRALLRHFYGIGFWDIPAGYLCPPIPGRADYIHHVADLLSEGKPTRPQRGRDVAILDIGVGANCVYPIIGVAEYGWRFVGTDVDPAAIASATRIVASNPNLAALVEIRRQPSPAAIFDDVIRPDEAFAACLCNPPFHDSPAAAASGTQRKLRNLAGGKKVAPVLNFGGQSHELWCPGGEVAFVRRMIAESARRPELCRWFTTLVSKRESLPSIERALRAVRPTEMRKIDLAHGQKKSRIVAWTFGPAPRTKH